MRPRKVIASRLLATLILTLAASTLLAQATMSTPDNTDPYEKFNRAMYNFNDTFDRFLLKPIATLYNLIVPKPLVKGINNMFTNIDTIPTVVNDLLQAKLYQATNDTWRFIINSTFGLAGFFDIATEMGIAQNYEDLGLTFAQWGWRNSTYLVIPFLGPTTFRDGVAWPINYELFTVYPYIHPTKARYIIYGTNMVSKRASLLRFQSVMDEAALDRYVFVKNAFQQRRAYQIANNLEQTQKNSAKPTAPEPDNKTLGIGNHNTENSSR